MLRGYTLHLSSQQWQMITSAIANISQAIILFALAACFVPETVNLQRNFSGQIATLFLVTGLLFFILGIIIRKE